MVFILNLFPHLTALENIILPRVSSRRTPRRRRGSWACSLLARVGLSEKEIAYPEQLWVGSSSAWRLRAPSR